MALFNRTKSLFSKNLNCHKISDSGHSALDIFFKSSTQSFLSLIYDKLGNMTFGHIWSASSDVSCFVKKLKQYLMHLYWEINYILTLYYRIEEGKN